jgi:hypothetical protein
VMEAEKSIFVLPAHSLVTMWEPFPPVEREEDRGAYKTEGATP